MDVGIGLPATIPGVTGEQLIGWAKAAEQAGFHSLGTIDRIVYDNYEPLIALAAAAAVTTKIQLTTAILIAPLRRNGALLAKQAQTLNRISDGRMVLGVAVGGREDDYTASQASFRTRGKDFEAMLEEWERIWAGESFGTAGAIGPDSRPTLIMGGASDIVFARAAKYADGWIMGGGTPEQYLERFAQLKIAWEKAGRETPPRTQALAYFALGDSAEQAAQRYLGDYYAFLGPEIAQGIASFAATDAQAVKSYADTWATTGCDELIFMPCDPDPGQVELLAKALWP
jgi:alkanesulfonate monooxygenase SsuD/methylene tetrahydromethanopterin reductase-like flavin-dependent oxidoreductase (luciferase family)